MAQLERRAILPKICKNHEAGLPKIGRNHEAGGLWVSVTVLDSSMITRGECFVDITGKMAIECAGSS